MRSSLAVAFASGAVAIATAGLDAPLRPAPALARLEFRFIGNCGFQISDGRTTLLSDLPYESGYSGYNRYRPDTVTPTGRTVSLITHRHRDHFDRALWERTAWFIVGPREITAMLPAERVVPLSTPTRFGDVEIEPIATPHSTVEHYSYEVRWHGRRLYFTGDTETPEHLLARRGLDVAFVTPWLLDASRRQARLPDATRIVVYHYQTAADVSACDRCTVFEQGDGFTLDGR